MSDKEEKENPVTRRRKKNIAFTLKMIEALVKDEGKVRLLKALAVIIKHFGVSEKIARGYINIHIWDGSILIENGWIKINDSDKTPSHSQ